MEASFPPSEFRTYEGQRALLAAPRYRLITERESESGLSAFMAVWEFPEFRFVEHFAVVPAMRGRGLGERLLKSYLEKSPGLVLLEVEPPDSEWPRRRIGFYERLGFTLNPYPYAQPPLRVGQSALPLHIMSYPGLLEERQFAFFKETVFRVVYKVL
ncbi:GNAT family N-acetyltransferase [Paenibacillus sp. URB8-2]|uniref:GNAT family N-acetyltransferase n=1 Tax=Paenibacillus sp. URB8-2 TaxID=2741301 RepID=UPI0015BEE45F|nr:GNAT family N-acetyltransferase [Paenibacillus sp. URB8-2]BCG57750.1 hypothetical protein PUR_11750 [Paenibacillus sp. URB8-2]